MSDYSICRIFKNDRREMKKLDALLEKEGIERDKNLDYTAGIYDSDYHLIATGSCFKNTLRCMAVDSEHQGEGLLNQIVSHLIEYEYEHGIIDLFLYTKCDKALFFKDLGFYEIARVDGRVVFMENRKKGFQTYLEQLRAESSLPMSNNLSACNASSAEDIITAEDPLSANDTLPVGAVIMNANPFTLGHQYLIERASAACRLLHVFVVSEDVSLVPFPVRWDLVKQGVSHLKNLVCHQTGSYMISSSTFPSYFLKEEDTVIRSHAALDIAVFKQIAKFLQISVRFVGEEPFSQVTGIYNQVMSHELKKAGIDCRILPRKKGGTWDIGSASLKGSCDSQKGGSSSEETISASRVRQLIHDGQLELIKELVPDPTYRYFLSSEAEPVIRAIQEEQQVVHY